MDVKPIQRQQQLLPLQACTPLCAENDGALSEGIMTVRKHHASATLVSLLALATAMVVFVLVIFSGANRRVSLDFQLGSLGTSAQGNGRVCDSSDQHSVSRGASFASSLGTAQDKLLGGLLTRAFDEASCLSRYRSALYWNVLNHKPSPYLLEKLRDYEALHKKCGPNTDFYRNALEQLESNYSNGPLECNYLVWTPSDGLGNRILTMVSAFLYALLNKRVLLLYLPDDMVGLFCEPFPNSSWVLPSYFPVKDYKTYAIRDHHSYGNMLENKVLSNNMYATNASLPAYVYLYLRHDYTDLDKLFFCEEAQLLLERFPWLLIGSNQYFVPALFLLPRYAEELSRLFPEKETVFHHLGRYLLHPSNSVWGYITRYYEAYLANAKERVGIQIRNFQYNKLSFEEIFTRVLNCSLGERLLPNINLKEPTVSDTNGVQPKAVLVTSLDSGYYEKLKNMYYDHATATGEVIGVYQPSHEEKQRTEQLNHNMKALSEMYLLSFSDILVTTSWSTFGYVAQGLGGLKPWILLRPENNNPACRRAMSMEPCFQYPQSYDCRVGRKIDKGALVPHVRHCEDFKGGLKLVD